MVTVEVPVKLYIKKYLENNYSAPCRLEDDEIGECFYKLLRDAAQSRESKTVPSIYNAVVEIEISEDVCLKGGQFLSPINITGFNNFTSACHVS